MPVKDAGTYWPAGKLPESAQAREKDLSHAARDNARRRAMDTFLAGVERRAFVFARAALGHESDALDVVQDAMMNLVRRYASRPAAEWQLLFFRILKNRIVDLQRRGNVRNRVIAVPSAEVSGDRAALVESAPARSGDQPERQAAADAAMGALQSALTDLPPRQQQAFLLRVAEGLNVAETAAVMECSEGSVKTHYSRAVHRLRDRLGDHW